LKSERRAVDEQMDRFAPLTDEDRATAILAAPPKHDDGDLISPVPADAPDLPMAHHQHGKPSQRWAYRDAAGTVLFWLLRFDPPGRCKQFLPLTLWRHRERLAPATRGFVLDSVRPRIFSIHWIGPDIPGRWRNVAIK
jgi:hypothetical protein